MSNTATPHFGTLFLLPNTLGQFTDTNASLLLSQSIPSSVLQLTAQLDSLIAENAKTTRAFLKQVNEIFPLTHPLQSIQIQTLNVNTPENDLEKLLAPLLVGKDVGLISEAGLPAIADPGANLVKLAQTRDIPVRPMVGPCSLLLGLMGSGLNGQSFAFNGYLPQDALLRSKRIKELEDRSRQEQQTQIFIETPYRNQALLESFLNTCHPQTHLCVATDLSLESENLRTQSIQAWKKTCQTQMPDFHKKPTVFLFLAS